MAEIVLRTPCCKRKVASVDVYRHATIVVKRRCTKCKMRYNVVVTPLEFDDDKVVSKLDWHITG